MKKKPFLQNRQATENLGYLIKLIVGSVIIIGVVAYMCFVLKPNYEQVKEITSFIVLYLMGYGTKEVVKRW